MTETVDDDPPWVFRRICYLYVSDLVPPRLADQARVFEQSKKNHDGHQCTSGQVSDTVLGFLFFFGEKRDLDEILKKTVDTNLIFYLPPPRYYAVWLIFFIMGLATLLPWNFFMTATLVSF